MGVTCVCGTQVTPKCGNPHFDSCFQVASGENWHVLTLRCAVVSQVSTSAQGNRLKEDGSTNKQLWRL